MIPNRRNYTMESKSILTPLVLALGFVLVALTIVFVPHGATTGTAPTTTAQQNVISVAGNAEINVMPDLAKLYVAIEIEKPTAKQAQAENARLTNTVKEALKKEFGLDDEHIQTSSYNIWPQQQWNPDTSKYEETTYRSTHVLEITTEDLTKVGDMLDVAISNGATSVQSIQFGMTKALEQDVNDQVLGRAADNAKSKAEGIAQTLGVRLGKIASISESNYNYQPYYFNTRSDMAMGAASEASYKSTDISPQEVTVSGTIQMSYLLE